MKQPNIKVGDKIKCIDATGSMLERYKTYTAAVVSLNSLGPNNGTLYVEPIDQYTALGPHFIWRFEKCD